MKTPSKNDPVSLSFYEKIGLALDEQWYSIGFPYELADEEE